MLVNVVVVVVVVVIVVLVLVVVVVVGVGNLDDQMDHLLELQGFENLWPHLEVCLSRFQNDIS